MAKRYKSNIEDDKRLNKTTGIIFSNELKNRIYEYAKKHNIEDYSFSFIVRELIEKSLIKVEELKKEKNENNILTDRNDRLKDNGTRK